MKWWEIGCRGGRGGAILGLEMTSNCWTAGVTTLTGGCRCGLIRYELAAEIGPVFNCHCQFCRRIHGAPFTTIALVPRSGLRWLEDSQDPAQFRTPGGSLRHFCGVCASPICNHPAEPELLCLVVSSLDDESGVAPWAHFNTESKAPWFAINDDLPQFEKNPTPEDWAALARDHGR